jgi:putative toxin-antitoxin system antitoxin component (TIGR02293 family)
MKRASAQVREKTGSARFLGIGAASTLELVRAVERGFAFEALMRFHRQSGMTVAGIAELLQLPPRTLVRRRASGRLRPEESERLLRLSKLFEKAVDVFEGDVVRARGWMGTKRRELGDVSPWELARTEIGAREVEDLIGRLEHGVFA